MSTFRKTFELRDGRTLTLRAPQLEDAQGLIDQMKCVDGETKFLAREAGEFQLTVEQEQDFIRRSLETDQRQFLIADVDGEIVGNCAVGLVSTTRRYRHKAAMGIAICKAYWHMGIGSKLMQNCIEWCRARGVEQLELEVVTENSSAIAMYEKFGFEIFGTKKHAMKYADGTYADEYYMILFLNEQ
ncbi:GNAT family N-acetyltransferase [Fusibacter paucivorans]|uniref:GNAT family N-acetyltransferase n=1 Tax=Fusibacter paucivorans TaxID=76009 RepID=A0ABS5PUF3_9FIRM|nr:GNAT family N-acetyltransferase [Fusibacter paucivorans]MBS7528487.1 GNAT family N-acetyltransferase [Fusibacter paucivorans]